MTPQDEAVNKIHFSGYYREHQSSTVSKVTMAFQSSSTDSGLSHIWADIFSSRLCLCSLDWINYFFKLTGEDVVYFYGK